MKSFFFKLLFFIFLLIDLNVFGQTPRIVDTRVRIISPLKGSYIKSPDNLNIKFSIFNKGPDTIIPADTLRFFPSTNDSNFKQKLVNFNKKIVPGDSDIFEISLPFNSKFDNNYYQICIGSAISYNRSSNSLLPEQTSTQSDNSNCTTLKHRSSTSSVKPVISSNYFRVFPNPAKNEVYLNFPNGNNDSKIEVKILGQFGQVYVLNGQSISSNDFRLDISDLNCGLYVITCNQNGLRYSKPILILK